MRILLALIAFFLTFLMPASVMAEDFAITKIGAMDVNGKYYNQWWYEPTKLTLQGTGSRGANVDIYIDGLVKTIKVSESDGQWKYAHDGELEKKDHSVKVASGDREFNFTLTIGSSSVPDSGIADSKELPQTGLLLPIVALMLAGGFLVYFGFREKIA